MSDHEPREETVTIECLLARVKAGIVELELRDCGHGMSKIIIDGVEFEAPVTKLVLTMDWEAGTLPTLTLTTLCTDRPMVPVR